MPTERERGRLSMPQTLSRDSLVEEKLSIMREIGELYRYKSIFINNLYLLAVDAVYIEPLSAGNSL
jgi:hypothetical protein